MSVDRTMHALKELRRAARFAAMVRFVEDLYREKVCLT